MAAILPLTSLQSAYWIHSTLSPDADPGVIQVRFTLHADLDRGALASAWNEAVCALDALRSTINTNAAGDTFLVVRHPTEVACDYTDLRHLSHEQQQIATDELASAEKNRGIDLNTLPTSRLHCAACSDQEHHCIWTCHHLLLDGWSSALVVQHFRVACETRSTGETYMLDAGLPLVNYHRHLATLSVEESLQYWKTELRGYRTPSLVCTGFDADDYDDTHSSRRTEKTLVLPLPDERVLPALQKQAAEHGTSIGIVLQAAWLLTLGSTLGRRDICSGLVTTGRHLPIGGIDRTVGLLSNVTPLRATLTADTPILHWLRQLHTQQLMDHAHEHVALSEILSQAEPACRQQAFDTLLAIEALPDVTGSSSDCRVTDYQSGMVSAFPLSVAFLLDEGGSLRADFQSARITSQQVEALLQTLITCLSRLSGDWSATLGSFQAALVPTASDTHQSGSAGTGWGPLRESVLSQLVAPRNTEELMILSLFESTLQRQPLSMDSHFFEHGGTSLGALQLLQQLEQVFDRRIPIAHFLSAPTPEALAARVTDGIDTQEISCLVPLNDSAARHTSAALESNTPPALYCLHAGGGHALFYRSVAERLQSDQPVLAVQPRGLDGEQTPLDTVSAMASDYISAIREHQPEGPYHLLCYCFGGALMLEIARQLDISGDRVGHLIVADAPSPVPATHPMSQLGWRAYLIYEFIVQRRFEYLAQGVETVWRKWRYRRQSESRDRADEHSPLAVQRACQTAFMSYRADPTAHHVHFLFGEDVDSRVSDAVHMRNWTTLAPSQSSVLLPGNHTNLFQEPYAESTARAIQNILNTPLNAESTRRSTTATEVAGITADLEGRTS